MHKVHQEDRKQVKPKGGEPIRECILRSALNDELRSAQTVTLDRSTEKTNLSWDQRLVFEYRIYEVAIDRTVLLVDDVACT